MSPLLKSLYCAANVTGLTSALAQSFRVSQKSNMTDWSNESNGILADIIKTCTPITEALIMVCLEPQELVMIAHGNQASECNIFAWNCFLLLIRCQTAQRLLSQLQNICCVSNDVQKLDKALKIP